MIQVGKGKPFSDTEIEISPIQAQKPILFLRVKRAVLLSSTTQRQITERGVFFLRANTAFNNCELGPEHPVQTPLGVEGKRCWMKTARLEPSPVANICSHAAQIMV